MSRILPFRSLTNRIFAATALLVVLAVGFTAVFVTYRVTAEAEAEVRRGLSESAGAVERRAETLSETFVLLARLVADLPRLKAAMATGDAPTVQPVAEEYLGALRQASLVAVTDARGRTLALAGSNAGSGTDAATWPAVKSAITGAVGVAYEPHPAGILQIVSVPVTFGRESPDVAGTLSVGFLLDTQLAAEFKALTGSEISFGLGGRIRASTLPQSHWAPLGASLAAGGLAEFTIDDNDYVALSQPVRQPGGAAGAGGGPAVVVARSRTERLRFLRTIQTVTLVTVIAAVLAATGLSYAVARTVTRPLAALTRTMRDVAATGDLTRTIPVKSGVWEDEDATVLASTFNTLIDSIARFEREATQRERLSALGRLSSVIAHEIRNPLMIIKASVRTLRDPGAPAALVSEAAADIDGEVQRLNRLVNDVLDFARPIRFEWHQTDVNALCEQAATVVRTTEPGVAVGVSLAPNLAPIVSDGERLRAVLVNALANACQAVRRSRGAEGVGQDADAPLVVVSTEQAPDGLRIFVRDRGVGIDPILLPRVFEPFVTTRRGGTGLGLAIAKNVVEGLGGTITLRNRPDGGAEVAVTLPSNPPDGPPATPGLRPLRTA
jgi:signal transduction histidine kinase